MAAPSTAAVLLRQAGVTQRDLAAMLGKSQQAVSYYLRGERTAPPSLRSDLSKLVGNARASRILEAIPR